ncbi:MAG: carboxypeptidase-like regulatory domain-containing protein [Acidobacteriota bacterium]|nr:carboxypeptidase-like regulatory domain-containing protein [Acidobacteriota bacterium]MDW3229369.1 carboxypeptidase-like regulatory domain-containing protein [Acidobacteriota bacterium]
MVKTKNNASPVSIFITVFLSIILVLTFISTLEAKVSLTGSIKGKITDQTGKPVSGAYIYLSSPSMVGFRYFLTRDNGYYFFHNLPSGTYRLVVETPGFHTSIINGIKVETGKTLSLPLTLEPAEEEEEKIILYPLPALDSSNPGISYLLDNHLLNHIPKTKDLANWLQLAPGVAPENPPYDLKFSVSGSTVRSNLIIMGVNEINSPLDRLPAKNINPDYIEEIEIVTAGHPVENYSTEGAFIKIVPKAGQNEFSGQLNFLGTGGNLSEVLWTEDELNQMSNPPVIKERYHLDSSLSLSGSILPDRVRYFTSFRYNQRSKPTPFSPWRDPFDIPYPMYNWKSKDFNSLFHFNSQITSAIDASLILSFNKNNQTVDPSFISPFNPQIATVGISGQNLFLLNAFGGYKFNQETKVNLFLFYTRDKLPRRLYYKGEDNPRYVDLGSGYSWGSGPYNQNIVGDVVRVGASVTRLQSFLKTPHELLVGVEYESLKAKDSTWKNNNLIYYYLFDNPYYFGQAVSPETGNLVSQGLVGFYLASGASNGLSQSSTLHRLVFYGRDSFSLGNRLSFYLGLKFERVQSGLSALYRSASGNAVSFYTGEYILKPLYGVNPYGNTGYPSWDNMIVWNNLSPRLGLVIDLLGTGKTLLKGSFNRYHDNLSLSYLMNLSPGWPTGYHLFYWYDENEDTAVDIDDTFRPFPEDYRIHQNDYFRQRVNPELKSPLTTEWTATFEQQLTEDFTLSLSYLFRKRNRIIEDVLYDPDNELEWYQAETPGDFWIPFSTIVPGGTGYDQVPVTVYFPSTSSPDFFTRLSNVEYLQQKYTGLQLVLRKRMSNNWQFLTSITWSRSQGNIGSGSQACTAFTQLANSPNSLVNLSETSRLDIDRPLVIKIMGSYHLPKDFYLSAFFQYMSGTPWARTVTIVPPSSWLEGHQVQGIPMTVYLEEPGARRWPAFNNLDLRLEKRFKVGQGMSFDVALDILNLLGKKYGLNDLNDGGYWYPETEGTSDGTRIFNPSFQNTLAVYGTRAAQLAFSLRF